MKKFIIISSILCLMLFTGCTDGSTTMDNGHDTDGMQGEPGVTENTGSEVVNDAEKAINDAVDGARNAVKDGADGVKKAAEDMTGR